MTGHTSDDQAETVLLNILRGTGLDGLAGIPQRRGRILRPILGVARAETRELATLLDLPWRDDPSNDDDDPRRNQIRRSVLPELETRFNSRLRASLAALAGSVADGTSLAKTKVQILQSEDEVALVAAELHAIGPSAASHVLRDALRLVRGPYPGTRAEVTRLIDVATGRTSSAELAGGFKAFRRGPWLVIWLERDAESLPAGPWSLPGSLWFGRWSFESWIDDRAPDAFPLSSWSAVVDADLLPSSVVVRVTEPGDELDGVSVSEILRQLGVSPEQRSKWPVVVTEEAVLWVPGARMSRAVWVGSATRRYLWTNARMEAL